MNIRFFIIFLFSSLIFTQDYSIQFDGEDDYVDIPYSSSIGFSDTPITWSVWFKKNTPSTHSLQTNLIANMKTGSTPLFGLYIEGNNWGEEDAGKLIVHYRTNESQSEKAIMSTFSVDDGNWHHAVAIKTSDDGE